MGVSGPHFAFLGHLTYVIETPFGYFPYQAPGLGDGELPSVVLS
jgi:hypothetical protein